MSGLEERERQFESKFKLDEEIRFKTRVRRNRMLGEWVAEQFGLAGDARKAYALDIVDDGMATTGDEHIVGKVLGDAAARGLEMDEHRLRRRMERMGAEAHAEIMKS